ncbi:alpha/beta hydrolase [Oculatella sp. LEGE 06141]|uniref:alpha/beta fold hydrolase n=1 Tax=Oculatella sp. LEGE 06141 TaxID=1828648 RepID=UPI0018820AB9|nr:alpha/beta hydrolase [Oculatella sp. LEGE 06141]MBE9179875.1 alpha/beta hydrolase [Oculatella sp. LEGE 06141]
MTLPIRNSRVKLSQGQLFWREVGYGTTLVFLHGSWNDGNQWLPIVEQLGVDHHCVIPDLLGFGESERPRVHHSIELQVECLAEHLEFLRLRQVYLIGHSVGGWLAASYALQHPDQVKGLVLLAAEGSSVGQVGRRWRWARWLLSRPPLMLWCLRLLRLFGWRQAIAHSLQFRQQLLQSPTACQLLFKRRRAEIQSDYLGDRISWLKLPILLLQGEQDKSTEAQSNQAYTAAPQATLQLTPGIKHDLLSAAPETVAHQIRDFIQQQEGQQP